MKIDVRIDEELERLLRERAKSARRTLTAEVCVTLEWALRKIAAGKANGNGDGG